LTRVVSVVLTLVLLGCTATPSVNEVDPWSAAAADNVLVTDPTPLFAAAEVTFLRQIAAGTWNLLSGADLNPATHLLRNSVRLAGNPGPAVTLAAATPEEEYTNPALIGNWLTAVVAAKDLGLVTAEEAQSLASSTLARLRRLATYRGFFFRWYDTETGTAIVSPQGGPVTDGYVSTVDNGWLAQGLVTAAAAFPALDFKALSDAMEWDFLYNKPGNVLYNGYQVGKGYSDSTYQNLYSGPRIADYMAIGSGRVPGALWWGLARTPPKERRQRQVPRGRPMTYTDPQNHGSYTVFEGHYVYDHIKFVPTFNGSLYQALAPALVVPEHTMAPNSLGLNNRNTALAHGAYGAFGAHSPVWGWVAATTPPNGRYTNYGVPDLGIDHGPISAAVASPYAAFLALPIIPREAYTNITELMKAYPRLHNQYGFLDSVNLAGGQVARRFMAISQTAILMAIDNAVNHNKLQTYLGDSTYGQAIAPYLAMERFTIEGLSS
jgi:putative glucoamylase